MTPGSAHNGTHAVNTLPCSLNGQVCLHMLTHAYTYSVATSIQVRQVLGSAHHCMSKLGCVSNLCRAPNPQFFCSTSTVSSSSGAFACAWACCCAGRGSLLCHVAQKLHNLGPVHWRLHCHQHHHPSHQCRHSLCLSLTHCNWTALDTHSAGVPEALHHVDQLCTGSSSPINSKSTNYNGCQQLYLANGTGEHVI